MVSSIASGVKWCSGGRHEENLVDDIIDGCLQSMWDEGPGTIYEDHGHYINMSSTSYEKMACGFYRTSGGAVWSVQNFK